MPRKPRISAGGLVYHILNRGNCRMEIFSKVGDYLAFTKLLEEGRQRTSMRILAWCLMPNHWHLVLWPRQDGDLSEFVGWISNTHVRRWRAHRDSSGEGHLYQGRYKSFIIAKDEHLRTVLRYVEQNPLRGGLCKSADRWRWSSASPNPAIPCDDWPIPLPANWSRELDENLPEPVLERLRLSIQRGRPYGPEQWQRQTASRLGLQHTLRNPWRPTKSALRANAPG